MCTLTFVPVSSSSYIFTSNRDERKSRSSAFAPTIHKQNGIKFLAPIDGEALGTWLGASEQGRVVCLLNGGFQSHIPTPPYKHSRGKVVLDALVTSDYKHYLDTYDFNNIEPFTLIVVENRTTLHLSEFVWDGKRKYFKELDNEQPYIWSSSTLYTDIQKDIRSQQYFNWLEDKCNEAQDILAIHEALDLDESFGLSMQRPQYCTVSTTQLEVDHLSVSMLYHDRLSQDKDKLTLPFTLINHES